MPSSSCECGLNDYSITVMMPLSEMLPGVSKPTMGRIPFPYRLHERRDRFHAIHALKGQG